MKKYKLNAGFTLLLSILVVSVILSVGLGIFDIMTKELKLSGIGRESQIAFYAADAGIECFFYWEIKHPDLADSAFAYYDSNPPTISCAGNSFSIPAQSNGHYGPYNINLSNNSCAKIKVDKTKSNETTVESRGYNTACDSTSSFKVERAIRLESTKKQGSTASAPGVPGNVQAQAVSQSQINLSWNAASGASNYFIYRGTDANNLSKIGDTTAASYNNTGLTYNTTYFYQVVASNDYGYTAESIVASATTLDIIPSSRCVVDGGSWDSSKDICWFVSSCAAGWTQKNNFTVTSAASCGDPNAFWCGTPRTCTTGYHSTQQDQLPETCGYYPCYPWYGYCTGGTSGGNKTDCEQNGGSWTITWGTCTANITSIGCKKN